MGRSSRSSSRVLKQVIDQVLDKLRVVRVDLRESPRLGLSLRQLAF
jgi:hypothetical protein